MMSNFMCNNVCTGKITGGMKAFLKLPEKRKIYVYLLITGTIEWSGS